MRTYLLGAVLMISLILACHSFGPVRESSQDSPLSVSLEVRAKDLDVFGHIVMLHFTLINNSSREFTYAPYTLPWYSSRHFTMRISEVNSGEMTEIPKPRSAFDCEPPFSFPLTLKPGDSIEGDYELRRRVPDFEKRLRKSEILIEWSYHPHTAYGDEPLSPLKGQVILPRRSQDPRDLLRTPFISHRKIPWHMI